MPTDNVYLLRLLQTNTYFPDKSSSVNAATNSMPANTSARAKTTRYTPSSRDT